MSSSYSYLDWVLSHWVHSTVHSLDLFVFICVHFVFLFFILHIYTQSMQYVFVTRTTKTTPRVLNALLCISFDENKMQRYKKRQRIRPMFTHSSSPTHDIRNWWNKIFYTKNKKTNEIRGGSKVGPGGPRPPPSPRSGPHWLPKWNFW